MYRQNLVKQFLTFLISEEYTKSWKLFDELQVTRRILSSDNHELKSKISTETSGISGLSHSHFLAKVLHCEQTMIFKMLTDKEILNQLVDKLICKMQTESIETFLGNNPQITLDIVTYNDMCPKCFATCFYMQQRLQSYINSLLIEKLDKLNFLSEQMCFPVPVTILISSFRPFKVNETEFSRSIDKTPNTLPPFYTEYKFAVPLRKYSDISNKRILQIFNPWIEGGITVFKENLIKNDIDDIEKLLPQYLELKGSISKESKKITTTFDNNIMALVNNINGFIRDFRISQFYDELQQNPISCLDSLIGKLILSRIPVNETLEKLKNIRSFIDYTIELSKTLNSTNNNTQALFNYLTNIQEIIKDIPNGILIEAKGTLNNLIQSRITTPETKNDLLQKLEKAFTKI